jgi:hypothetical protein
MLNRLNRIGALAVSWAAAGCDTDYATLVGDTFATLNLSVDAFDVAACGPGSPGTCSWFWQYATSASALSPKGQAPCTGSCPGVTRTPRVTNTVKQTISSLAPNTTYHFQVCARMKDSDPDICASIKRFKTGPHARVDPSNTRRFLGETGQEFFAVGYNQDVSDIPSAEQTFDDPNMPVLKQRLLEIRNHGSTAARLMLPEVTHVMTDKSTFDKPRLDAFTGVMDYAESIGLKVVLSGLWDYNTAPSNWYENLGHADRWTAQANYWREFARRLSGNSAVFSYNLINEANVPSSTNVPSWRQGPYGYWLSKTAPVAPRTTSDVARDWIRKITAAIREVDSLHMITMGGAWPGPIPYTLQAQELSYLSPHIYPAPSRTNQTSVNALRAVKSHGKPVVEDEINGLTVLKATNPGGDNEDMEWLLVAAGDTLNGVLQTSCHEESCLPVSTCPPGDGQFGCQIGRDMWIKGAAIFKSLIPVLTRTGAVQSSLRQHDSLLGGPPKICGMPRDEPSGYTVGPNVGKARLMADTSTRVIVRFAGAQGRNQYATSPSTASASTALFDSYATNGFTFERAVGSVYPSLVAGTVPLKVYVNAAGNEYLTAAPNEAALSAMGYSYARTIGYGWLP